MSELLNNNFYDNCNYASVPQKVNKLCAGNTCLSENELRIIKQMINDNKSIEHFALGRFGNYFNKTFTASVLGTDQRDIISSLNESQLPTGTLLLTSSQVINLANSLLLMNPLYKTIESSDQVNLNSLTSNQISNLIYLTQEQIQSLINSFSKTQLINILNLKLVQLQSLSSLSTTQLQSLSSLSITQLSNLANILSSNFSSSNNFLSKLSSTQLINLSQLTTTQVTNLTSSESLLLVLLSIMSQTQTQNIASLFN
jgi:hypothetical protein